MEAVPRLPMISFDVKISPDRPPTEFSKLKQYIRDIYNEDPETYSTEIRNIETLRAQAIHPMKDVNGCAILKKYYCQLHFLESRFPMSKDGPAAVTFTWRDIYSGIECSGMDIKYEMVSILYNIGALHSQMGASDDRTTPEGLKMACTHFQCAAWAFQHIKDSYAHSPGMDLSTDLMQFMYQLSLAQGQECILEKSMTDNRKATINARVATQIVDYYNLAQNALIQGGNDDNALVDIVGSKLMKTWKRYVRFKSTYYTCISLLYQGMQSEEQQKMGERVAYFQAALDKLNEAIKLSKGFDQADAVTESLLFTRDVVECKRKAAKSENEFIYHEEVVDVDSLPSVKGASLVKGISFNINDPDISGPDIFARLVPMKAHEASSLYSEEKAKLLRKINGLIDSKDEEVVSFMSCLQLDHLKAHLEPNLLPQEVVDRCAALSAKPDAIPNLIAAMDKLNDAYHDVDGMLQEIMELIKAEEINEKEYQDLMGSRAPSIVATDLTREANKYMEAHKKAADSNETLNRAMSQHVENLRVLQQSLVDLQAQLPTLSPLKLEESESLKEVTMLVGKVDEMRKQRAMLASQLRESICSDDITTILVTRNSENIEALFEDELKKHDRYVKLIEQNLSAQENILKALTDAYARYAPTRKATSEIIKQRELMLSALVSSYDAYEDLIAKSSKGMEFYRKLETNLTKLLQRVKGTCRVQQEEREAILSKNNIKVNQEPVIMPEVSNTGPKLKDYLQKRKEAQAMGGTYPVGFPVDQGQNWLPGIRPAPVGSEVTLPIVSSTNKPHEYAAASVGAYVTANITPYQQPYTAYQVPYGHNVQNPYQQPPLNNLQYPTISDSPLPVDSAPTAPYRPDSRASTSSDHSLSQHQLTAPVTVPVLPSSDPRTSPIHGTDNQSTSISAMKIAKQDQVSGTTSGQNFGQMHSLNYQGYQYQGYSYPPNYIPYSSQPSNSVNSQSAANVYPVQQPNLQHSNAFPQSNIHNNQVTSSFSVQPTNVSIIQVNSGIGTQRPIPPSGGQTPNVQVSSGPNTPVVSVNASPGSQPTCVFPNNAPAVSTYYDPSSAKAMSVPSASYNGPYGSNTITSPYANYYTSQMYNGNVSSTATDKTSYPLHLSSSASQTSSSVYSSSVDSPSSYTPTKNNQVPTTTYTVPANQQFTCSQAASSQPYAAPSLVSPTQTSYDVLNSGQVPYNPNQISNIPAATQNPYASTTPQSSTGQVVATDNSGYSYSANANKPTSTVQYGYGQAQMGYSGQYSNYYYGNNATAQYSSQATQSQYSNYAIPYTQQGQQMAYSSGQASVAANPYGTASQVYQNYNNQLSTYPVSDQTTSAVNRDAVRYGQGGAPPNYIQQQIHAGSTSQVSPANYSQGVGHYIGSDRATVQQQPSSSENKQPGSVHQQHYAPPVLQQPAPTGQQQQQVHNYVQPTNYVAPTQQTGMVYGQQPYNYSGQAVPNYANYSPAGQQVSGSCNAVQNQTPAAPLNQTQQPARSAETKSNVDLLAGLDFTVSDAPLQPISQPASVDRISDSLSSLNFESKSSDGHPSVNGESKPQVELSANEIKQDDKILPIVNPSTKSEESGSKPSRDPFTDADALNQFVQEVDKFEKFVEGLCAKTLSGPTPLDIKWNELQDLQEKDGHRQNISVARCYPMKNRFPDILPYDNSTVELPSTKDDYINASFVKNMCNGCPDFILTQAPLVSTYADFWTMILEQHIELVVCLLSDAQMDGEIYWPQSKTDDLTFGHLKVSLQSCNTKSFWVERVISVSNNKSSRVIVHLQFTAWPNSWFPESPGPWLQLVGETLSVWRGCRNPESCIVVHCDAGVGRSGLFVATAAALSEMLLSPHIPEMVHVAASLAKWRKNPLRDRDHLKFAYQTILYYCQDILMKRGILSSKGTFEEKRSKGKSHTRHPSQDFLLNSTSHSTSNEERRHSDTSSTGSKMSEIDPLNQLDPLWQIKRQS